MKNDIIATMKKDVLVQIRITAETKKALDKLAKDKNTSLTRLIEFALAQQFPEIAEHLPSF